MTKISKAKTGSKLSDGLLTGCLSPQGSMQSGHQTAERARTLKAAWDRLRNLTTCVCKCFEGRHHLQPRCCQAQQQFARVLLGAARAAVKMQSFCQGKKSNGLHIAKPCLIDSFICSTIFCCICCNLLCKF